MVIGLFHGRALRFARFLLLLFLFLIPSSANIGYDILVNGPGVSWEIRRETQNIDFSMEGTISGEGNFSRLTHVQDLAGIKADEKSSSTRGGSLNFDEKMLLLSQDGPVTIIYNLRSTNVTDTNNETINTGSAKIDIDEAWPVYLANYKKIDYLGPAIRTAERYDNNGDTFASAIDSKKLTKQSIYSTYINRTVIHVEIMPGRVLESRDSNKSSYYDMDMQTIGSLAHLGIIRQSVSGDVLSQISEDYKGQAKIGLRSNMSDSVCPQWRNGNWLPCCTGVYFDMSQRDRKYSVAKSIINDTCHNSSFCMTNEGMSI